MKKRILITTLISFILFLSSFIPAFAFPPSSDDIFEGIDVSDWQGEIDFKEVKNSGIDMVYIRASEGANYVDSYFKENYESAKENGLKVGFYHFLTATSIEEAKEEAKFFVNTIRGTKPDLSQTVLHVLLQ